MREALWQVGAGIPAALTRSRHVAGPVWLPQWGLWLALTAAYMLAANVGLSLAFLNGTVSAVWPASGLALAALIRFGMGMWPGIWLGALLANLATAIPAEVALGISVGSTLGAVAGAYLIRKLTRGRPFLYGTRDILVFVVVCTLASTAISATIGVARGRGGGGAGRAAPAALWITWWVGDSLGVLVVTPLLACWPGGLPLLNSKSPRMGEAAVILLVTVTTNELAFGPWSPVGSEPLKHAYIVLPALIWAAQRFLVPGAAVATALTSVLAVSETMGGHGAFAGPSANQALIAVQLFLGVGAVMVLFLGATVTERLRAEGEARRLSTDLERKVRDRTADLEAALQDVSRGESKFRGLVEAAPDGVILVGTGGKILVANRQMQALFDYRPEDLVGQDVEILVPDGLRADHVHHRQVYAASPRGRTSVTMGARLDVSGRRKDGSEIPLEITLSPIEAPDGPLVVAVIRDITQHKRREATLRDSIRQKTMLVKEIHHRVKNNLQIISTLLQLQADQKPQPPGLSRVLTDCRNRIQTMALVHESLLQSEGLASIDMHDFIGRLAKMVGQANRTEREVPIALRIEADHVLLPADTATPLGLILNEALANCYEHAFGPARPGTIQVTFRAQGDRHLLTVRDDGRGLPEGFDLANPTTLGVKLITGLSGQVGATASIRTDDGTVVEIALPSRPPEAAAPPDDATG